MSRAVPCLGPGSLGQDTQVGKSGRAVRSQPVDQVNSPGIIFYTLSRAGLGGLPRFSSLNEYQSWS